MEEFDYLGYILNNEDIILDLMLNRSLVCNFDYIVTDTDSYFVLKYVQEILYLELHQYGVYPYAFADKNLLLVADFHSHLNISVEVITTELENRFIAEGFQMTPELKTIIQNIVNFIDTQNNKL